MTKKEFENIYSLLDNKIKNYHNELNRHEAGVTRSQLDFFKRVRAEFQIVDVKGKIDGLEFAIKCLTKEYGKNGRTKR